ncbi:uncharacterized protein LOC144477890 [Augochlora pura]
MHQSKEIQRRAIVEEIAKVTDIIRKKSLALKVGKMETESNIEANLRPVVEPLKQLVQNTTQVQDNKPISNQSEVHDNKPISDQSLDLKTLQPLFSMKKVGRKCDMNKKRKHDEAALTPRMHFNKKKKKIYSTATTSDDINYAYGGDDYNNNDFDGDDNDDDNHVGVGGSGGDRMLAMQQEEAFESSPTAATSLESSMRDIFRSSEKHHAEYEQMLSNLGPLASEYLGNFFSGPLKNLDNVYGVYFHNDKLIPGNAAFDVESNDDIIINKIRYKGTPGLYELVFKRIPDCNLYTENDKKTYKDILIATHAHRRSNQIMGNKGFKYKTIIGPMFSTLRGKGMQIPTMMRVTNNPIDYVHWDDPNELVDRLELLMVSRNTGHTAHDNEIISVIEELREAGLIIN